MKHMIIFFALFFLPVSGFATKHTVVSSGYTFSPSAITINLGDTVVFSLSSIHNAEEVSQATYDANGGTSNGGFETAFGGGTVVLTHTGTFYYVCAVHYYMGMKGTITVSPLTGVNPEPSVLPAKFVLGQNYPNPFNPQTTISYALPSDSKVQLSVFNLIGQMVVGLVDGVMRAGEHSVTWDASELPSGIYFYRLNAVSVGDSRKSFTNLKKMILVK